MKGKVYLVGAGPGDPELLTLKALRLLRTAEAVLHDDLVGPEILRLIPPTAQVHNVGKRCGTKEIRQEEINFLMVALASSGLQVIRLKGGDPLIFGRAGEEMESLRDAGIPYEIVPGVTSALGAAAAAQIPLTHRNAASALVFITGHRASQSDAADWNKFVGSGATLVIYMPGQNSAVAAKLKSAGLAANTLCAVVSAASTGHQRTHLATIAELQRAPKLAAPTLLIVGEVVRQAYRASTGEESLIPNMTELRDNSLPAAFFQNFLLQSSRLTGDEEPIA
jgi:uroporphyrin-III C-methyltransferase